MRRILSLLLAGLLPVTALAQGLTNAELQGVTINTVNTYSGNFRNERGTAPGNITVRGEIKLGEGGSISSRFTRSVVADTPKGTKTGSLVRTHTATIGKPQKASDGSGNLVWVLEGNALVRMRTLQSGGHMHRISITRTGTEWRCASDLPMMREVGGGNIKDRGAIGGQVEILSIRQTGSSCRIAKP
jgi:hypothetical protein